MPPVQSFFAREEKGGSNQKTASSRPAARHGGEESTARKGRSIPPYRGRETGKLELAIKSRGSSFPFQFPNSRNGKLEIDLTY